MPFSKRVTPVPIPVWRPSLMIRDWRSMHLVVVRVFIPPVMRDCMRRMPTTTKNYCKSWTGLQTNYAPRVITAYWHLCVLRVIQHHCCVTGYGKEKFSPHQKVMVVLVTIHYFLSNPTMHRRRIR